LPNARKNRVIATLKEYLACEWKAKRSKKEDDFNLLKSLTGSIVNVPLQHNYFDCGIYLLQYVESFFTVSKF
jgi:Ulp1 family protease